MPEVHVSDAQEADRRLPPIPAEIQELAPLHLPGRRARRYGGDAHCLPLPTLAPRDQDIIVSLYRQLLALQDILLARDASVAGKTAALRAALPAERWPELFAEIRTLGRATYAAGASGAAVGKAIHDVRSRALTALFSRLELLLLERDGAAASDEAQLKTLFVLTRDHGKIMRNALLGLDDERRQRDLQPKSHHAALMVEKWHDSVVSPQPGQEEMRLFVDCRFDGSISECCLESAAIDRVFYNLVGNAVRHSAGDRLDLLIYEIPQTPGDNLRFVLTNALTAAHTAALRALANPNEGRAGNDGDGDDFARLFQPEVSTTGSGLGLAIVADFVADAFGLRDNPEALRGGYLGARLLRDGRFAAWFHWPSARDDLDVKPADYT